MRAPAPARIGATMNPAAPEPAIAADDRGLRQRRFACSGALAALLALAPLAPQAQQAQQSPATTYGVEVIVFRVSSVPSGEDWDAVPPGRGMTPHPSAARSPRPRLTALARARGVRVVVDNTFASPVLQQPLALGATVVLHSTTKYINGHSDVVGGALVTSDAELCERLPFFQNAIGAVPSGSG